MEAIKSTDSEIFGLIRQEEQRQCDKIRLIASENYVSAAVLQATGTILTNKYSEGYAGKRYYEGQQIIDQIETLAMKRAKKLFGVRPGCARLAHERGPVNALRQSPSE